MSSFLKLVEKGAGCVKAFKWVIILFTNSGGTAGISSRPFVDEGFYFA